jgi:hypothetical protein
MIAALLSGRIGCLLAGCAFEGRDDLLEVPGDLPVHLGQPVLAAGLGGGDDLQDFVVMVAVPGQELRAGDEGRAGQAPLTEPAAEFGHVARFPGGSAASLPA